MIGNAHKGHMSTTNNDWHDSFRKDCNEKRLDMSDKLGADGCNATMRSHLTSGEHKEGGSFYNH